MLEFPLFDYGLRSNRFESRLICALASDPSRGLCDQYINRMLTKAIDCQLFVLTLKIWATRRKLCETQHGGLSCVALVLLGIYHFNTVGAGFDSFFAFLPSGKMSSMCQFHVDRVKMQQDVCSVDTKDHPRNIIYRLPLPADKRNEFDTVVNALINEADE
jgi:hypothetical protein